MNTAARHHIDCEWHHDQYDWECTCGATRPVAQSTTAPAQELRELARDIYALTGTRRIASLAWPAMNALCEYLALRARVMELEEERERYLWRDKPAEETPMNSQAKSAVQQLKQTIEKLNQAQSNPQQLQQLVQELQQQIQKVEGQLERE